jgi:hypothetical protein
MASFPVKPVETLERRFRRLADAWRAETAYLSSSTAIFEHPAYQEIIQMGPEAIPLLLRELSADPDHWAWALTSITGENPVPPADRGNLPRMTEAWLRWGREHGYRW